jgi:hypothetical protein
MMVGFSFFNGDLGRFQSWRYATVCAADNEKLLRAQRSVLTRLILISHRLSLSLSLSLSLCVCVSLLVAKVLSIIQSKRKVRSYVQANAQCSAPKQSIHSVFRRGHRAAPKLRTNKQNPAANVPVSSFCQSPCDQCCSTVTVPRFPIAVQPNTFLQCFQVI